MCGENTGQYFPIFLKAGQCISHFPLLCGQPLAYFHYKNQRMGMKKGQYVSGLFVALTKCLTYQLKEEGHYFGSWF
jgi:hypothetical protein